MIRKSLLDWHALELRAEGGRVGPSYIAQRNDILSRLHIDNEPLSEPEQVWAEDCLRLSAAVFAAANAQHVSLQQSMSKIRVQPRLRDRSSGAHVHRVG